MALPRFDQIIVSFFLKLVIELEFWLIGDVPYLYKQRKYNEYRILQPLIEFLDFAADWNNALRMSPYFNPSVSGTTDYSIAFKFNVVDWF